MTAALNQGAGPLELGATLLSTIAYPGDGDRGKRDKFAGALICAAVSAMSEDINRFGEPPEALRMVCAGCDHNTVGSVIKAGCRIITNERLIAAKMALPGFHAFLADKLGLARPSKVPTHGGDDMLSAISMDLDDSDRPRDPRGPKPSGGAAELNKANILKRRWAPSLPVMHFCIALQRAIELSPTLAKNGGANLGDILFDENLSLWIIERANEFGPIVAEKFGIDKNNQFYINVLRD